MYTWIQRRSKDSAIDVTATQPVNIVNKSQTRSIVSSARLTDESGWLRFGMRSWEFRLSKSKIFMIESPLGKWYCWLSVMQTLYTLRSHRCLSILIRWYRWHVFLDPPTPTTIHDDAFLQHKSKAKPFTLAEPLRYRYFENHFILNERKDNKVFRTIEIFSHFSYLFTVFDTRIFHC